MPASLLYTDLTELKAILEIPKDDKSEDLKLNFLMEQASQWIEEILGRPNLIKKARTEYYDGTATQKLLLRSRPVYTSPTIQVFEDNAGYFGSVSGSFDTTNTALTYGTDFALKIDQDDGTSRSAILVRIGRSWPRPRVRETGLLAPFAGNGFGNIKVIYTAGYTVDTLPPVFRTAANLLIARLRYVLPLGVELQSEGYEERNVAVVTSEKEKLLALVKPMLFSYRNWAW